MQNHHHNTEQHSLSISNENKVVATKLFDRFFTSDTLDETLNYFSQITEVLGLKPGRIDLFYPILKQCILSNNAKSLFRILDEKRKTPVYKDGKLTANLNTLVVGCGPCGMRTGIEAQLMGSRVVMLEKRKAATRNNVLHIWPFVIEDLKTLGVKVFFPKFCTGSMNHISIRRLQSVLVKVALVLGVEIHVGVSFASLEEPRDPSGFWHVRTTPTCPSVMNMEIDVLVGAEGKRVTVPGFPRKEFRGKLAIAITANFVNNHTTPEAVVEEISGIAFVYKQDFFNALYDELGIALENIVYYKDETHYFVMTTKKHSLLSRGVLKEDYKDPLELLHPKNVEQRALLDYIRDTCDYCTDYQLPNLQFALNHHGQPDVALFDFTSMFAARNSIHVKERHSKQLLSCLVGDGLLEPFWPTGTGCARGFLGAFDACWAIKSWAESEKSILQIIAEREAIFKLLPQTTPENISKESRRYTIDPSSRYSHVNYRLMSAEKVLSLYDSDRMEHGWKSPFVGHKRLDFSREVDLRRQMIARANRNEQKNMSILNDLTLLEEKTAALTRQLSDIEPKRTGSDLRAEFNQSQQRINEPGMSSKPSIWDKKPTNANKNESQINRLTADQMAVLMDPSSLEGNSNNRKSALNKKNSVGKLTSDMMSVLTGASSSENARKLSNTTPGRLGADQLSVLSPQGSNSNNLLRKSASMSLKLRPDENKSSLAREGKSMPMKKKTKKRSSASDFMDMELDDMLAQLEHDPDFQTLTDNEKMSWLESLFFLDTGPSPRRSLNKVEKPDDRTLSINKSATISSFPTDPQPARKASVISQPTKPSTVSKKEKEEAAAASHGAGVNVNANLVSLAQSFFANEPGKKQSPSVTTAPKPAFKSNTLPKPPKTLSIPSDHVKQSPSPTSPIPERAFFEPSSPKQGVKQLIKEESPEFQPPPIPPRSNPSKTAMLRLMSNATNILKN